MSQRMKLFVLILSFSLYGAEPDPAIYQLRERFEKGHAAFNSGDYKGAIEYFEQAVEINPDFAPVYNSLGLAHHAINAKLSDVIWLFKVAVDISPNYYEPHNNMCKIYYQEGEAALAEKACLAALKINPNLLNSQLYLAWIYLLGKSQPREAVIYFKKVLTHLQRPMVYFGLGVAYSMNGDRAEVLEVITTLRGMQEEHLALQLETTLRSYEDPSSVSHPALMPMQLTRPQRQSSQIIGASQAPVSVPRPTSQPVSGSSRIRLRGTLSNVGGSQPAQTASPGPSRTADHPGSLAIPSSSSTPSTAIERIRKLQRRQIDRTSGTFLPKGSGY